MILIFIISIGMYISGSLAFRLHEGAGEEAEEQEQAPKDAEVAAKENEPEVKVRFSLKRHVRAVSAGPG